MSDTPRTDAQINGGPCTRFAIYAGDALRDALVPSEFARELERDLAAMTAERDRLELSGIHTCHANCQRPMCKMRRELAAANKRCEVLRGAAKALVRAKGRFNTQEAYQRLQQALRETENQTEP